MNFTDYIKDVPDFPKPGIIFKDLSPLWKNQEAFHAACSAMAEPFKHQKITKVMGIESRGFIFGVLISNILNAGFVPVRKKGKLPGKVIQMTYDLEYGTDTIEILEDSIETNDNVLLVDDLLATGGTAKAAAELIEKVQGKTCGISFFCELSFLKGKEKLGREYKTLVTL